MSTNTGKIVYGVLTVTNFDISTSVEQHLFSTKKRLYKALDIQNIRGYDIKGNMYGKWRRLGYIRYYMITIRRSQLTPTEVSSINAVKKIELPEDAPDGTIRIFPMTPCDEASTDSYPSDDETESKDCVALSVKDDIKSDREDD